MSHPGPILVTGATGKQGGAVARKLAAAGWKVRALVRRPEKASLPSGVEAMKGDQEDLDSVRQAAVGCHGVFSVQPLCDGDPDREVKMGLNVLDAAQWAGVSHLVYSSAVGSGAKNVPHFESKGRIERAVRESGIRYTILRPAGFMENLLQAQAKKSILKGKLMLPWSERVEGWWIAVDDIAEFTRMAFEQPGRFAGVELDLASEKRTGEDVAAILTRVTGRKVTAGQLPWIVVRLFIGGDVAAMSDWLESNRFGIDTGALRMLHPAMSGVEEWARRQDWKS